MSSNTSGTDFSREAARLADKIEPGSVHRIHSYVGETRSAALGGEGKDDWREVDTQDEIAAFMLERVNAHKNAPKSSAWFALRREGKAGNVIVSTAFPVGDTDPQRDGTYYTKDNAIAALAGMAPTTLRVVTDLLKDAIEGLTRAKESEMRTAVAMAELIGRAEGGEAGAMADAIGRVGEAAMTGPIGEMLKMWAASKMGGGAPPPASDVRTGEDARNAWDSWPDEAKRGLWEALQRAAAEQQQQQQGGGDDPAPE